MKKPLGGYTVVLVDWSRGQVNARWKIQIRQIIAYFDTTIAVVVVGIASTEAVVGQSLINHVDYDDAINQNH